MAKLGFSKISVSLSRIPHWLAPVVFAFSVITIIAALLVIITFIATAVSDASLLVSPPTPDSVLDMKKLSRIGPRLGLDGIASPNNDPRSEQGVEIIDEGKPTQSGGSSKNDGVKTLDNTSTDVPIEDSQ